MYLQYTPNIIHSNSLHSAGFDYVGMVEPGLYKGWGAKGPTPYKDHVSWHSHSLVFGTGRRELEKSINKIKELHESISGGCAFHIKAIEREEIENYLLYSLKMPLKEYRLNKFPGERVDRETGEILENVRQQKRPIRTGDFVRLMDVMKDMQLIDFLCSGGEGRELIKRFKMTIASEQIPTRRLKKDVNRHIR